MLEYVPNKLKSQEMYEYAVSEEVEMFLDTPNEFRSQEISEYVSNGRRRTSDVPRYQC